MEVTAGSDGVWAGRQDRDLAGQTKTATPQSAGIVSHQCSAVNGMRAVSRNQFSLNGKLVAALLVRLSARVKFVN